MSSNRLTIQWLTKSLPMYNAFMSKANAKHVRGGRVYELLAISVLQDRFSVSINKFFIKKSNIIKYLLKNHTKHIISNVCVLDPYIIALSKFSSKAKNIAILHHIDEALFNKNALSKLFYFNLKRNLKKMDMVVVVSEVWKNMLAKEGVKNITVIYNAFNVVDYKFSQNEIQAFKEKYNFDNSRPIVYLGPNSVGKGIDNVLEVIDKEKYQLVATGKTAVGDKNVKTLFFSENEFPLFLSSCDIVLCMSTMPEGWNRIAHESLLAGTPVIGSGTGGMGELLKKSNQVILLDIKNLNQEIEKVLQNPREFAEKGYDFVKQFNLEYFKKEWETLIESIAQ